MTTTTTTTSTDPAIAHDSSSLPLAGRTALVTGAGTGIGAATARALSARGATVALIGRRPGPIQEVAAEVGGIAVSADVSDADSLGAALGACRREVGRFDLVVANAGAMLAAPFDQAGREEWRRMLEVNVLGLLDTARLTGDDLLAAAAEGRPADLMLVSSIGAHLVLPGFTVYTATKAAVTQVSRNLRGEYGPRGVRVHAVEPGMTESDLGHDISDAGSRRFLADFAVQYPPIPAGGIAEAIAWSVGLPVGVNAAELVVLPTSQG